MPNGIPLGYWPSALDCVSWSKDDMIAVGGNEFVTVLAPQIKHAGQRSQVSLATNWYTEEESPLMDPLPWSIFSMPEELSERHVAAIAWSPPGLAKHQRCALAVLTSNHVLSIWECRGRPDTQEDWRRVLVLNHTLRDYFSSSDDRQSSTSSMPPDEYSARSMRIRSFAWSSTLNSSSNNLGGVTTSNHFLAISNECGDIVLAQVRSQYDLFEPERQHWQASVTHCLHTSPDQQDLTPLMSCLPSHTRRKPTFVDQLAWSRWKDDAYGAHVSTLAFVSQSKLYCSLVRSYRNPAGVRLECTASSIPLDGESSVTVAGPIQWSPDYDQLGRVHLVVFTKGFILCLSFEPLSTSDVKVTKHQVKNLYDDVSGVTFGLDENGNQTLSYTLFLTSTKVDAAVLRLPFDQDDSKSSPSWQRDISDAQALYSVAHDLGGNVCSRTYGLATSPLGDFIATCSSLHPTDGLEYTILADQSCSLIQSRERDTTIDDLFGSRGSPSSPTDIPSETLFLSLQRFRENSPNVELDQDKVSAQMLKATSVEVSSALSLAANAENVSSWSIARRLQRLIHVDVDMTRQRFKQLVALSRSDITKALNPDLGIIRTLVTEVLSLPQTLCDGNILSQNIRHNYAVVLAKLDERSGIATSKQLPLPPNGGENCAICSESLPFESLRWARCSRGHQFQRCSLTFLAIQSPGKAKSCGICTSLYLNELLIEPLMSSKPEVEVETQDLGPEQDGGQWVMVKQGESKRDPDACLARVLFTACDICIQCGGKFVG